MSKAAVVIDHQASTRLKSEIRKVVKELWTQRGASLSKNQEPGTLLDSGRLGIDIANTTSAQGENVFALVDSEKSSVDEELVQMISKQLGLSVHAFQWDDLCQGGIAKTYRDGHLSERRTSLSDCKEALAECLERPLYPPAFQHDIRNVQYFEGVPFSEGQVYSGPPEDCIGEFPILSNDAVPMSSDEVEAQCQLASDAGLSGDWQEFDRLMSMVPLHSRYQLHGFSHSLKTTDPLLSFRFCEFASHQQDSGNALNTALWNLAQIPQQHGLSNKRYRRLLHRAEIGAFAFWDMWHNLAHVYVNDGRLNDAKRCIRTAIERGLRPEQVANLKGDADLDPVIHDEDMGRRAFECGMRVVSSCTRGSKRRRSR